MVSKAKEVKEVAGLKVVNTDNLDGCKLIFNEGWLLIRPSGTEPLLRIYTETFGEDKTQLILNDILKIFNLK